jgi:hypothetical protein
VCNCVGMRNKYTCMKQLGNTLFRNVSVVHSYNINVQHYMCWEYQEEINWEKAFISPSHIKCLRFEKYRITLLPGVCMQYA